MTSSGADLSRFGALEAFDGLRDALFRYYDTPFGLANEALQKQRRQLLDQDGVVWREPLLEVRPRYQGCGKPLATSAAEAGAEAEFTELVAGGLVKGVDELYQHQHDALVHSLRDGKDVVITAGTGSGKTESFMLPVIASLVAESASWGGAPAPANRWWQASNGEYRSQRHGEHGRPQAVRAMILYPMNALVDDQLTRMRKALDSDWARQWLDTHRRGHRFYFGRYTGATPVPGEVGSSGPLKALRDYLQATEERGLQARADGDDGDAAFFVPRLDGGEMRSRWDMLDAPPDILVTNYSMLNVMMLRPREDHVFEMTRQWLENTPGAKFTLVVDELHMYRGTAGTEIAYLIRLLRHRLGLDRHPERLRILAASASLDSQRDLNFLSSFFGVDKDRFSVLPGQIVRPGTTVIDLSAHAARLAASGPIAEAAEATALLQETGAADALVNALTDDSGQPVARSVSQVGDRLFPSVAENDRQAAVRGVLALLRRGSTEETPKLRAHLFFRNISGMWACSDPGCPDADRPDDKDRTVGKLFTEPATRCSCGARVLEMLYCQTCGETFLGGYTGSNASGKKKFDAGLLPDYSELDQLPDRGVAGATAANYVVYWPRTSNPELEQTSWDRQSAKRVVHFAWRPSRYLPKTGHLENTRDGYTGWSFHVTPAPGKGAIPAQKLPPFPTQCPACGDDSEVRRIKGGKVPDLTNPVRLRSSIRGMRTGFEKYNQVLTDQLLAALPADQRKIVAFSDSRQDAANLASGIGLRHYQDLLRLLLYRLVRDQGDPAADIRLLRSYYRDRENIDRVSLRKATERVRGRGRGHELAKLKDIWQEEFLEANPEEEPELTAAASARVTLEEHKAELEPLLLKQGTNPGGPAASLQETKYKKGTTQTPWSGLFTWSAKIPERAPSLNEREQKLYEDIHERLREEVLQGLFSGAGRDFESLGLGWLCSANDDAPLEAAPTSEIALARASMRVLGHLRRFEELRGGQTEPPAKLKNFWAKVAEQHGLDPEDVRSRALKGMASAQVEFLIKPDKVSLRPPEDKEWVCSNCKRRHLHPGTLTCTKCYRPLPAEPSLLNADAIQHDYYSWQASSGAEPIRLNCAELTGQTDRIDAQSRQARFQKVFLGSKEQPRADEIDLLSVTTTMEAGVDIGALTAVLMANMPPTRFNYQQRVGRAGRRNSPVAVALTICRGRSHDDYYFRHPERITNEETPRPYLSMAMPAVFERVLASEVLRRAFRDLQLGDAEEGFDATRNVHGQFGRAQDWPQVQPRIETWIRGNSETVHAIADALKICTDGPIPETDTVALILNRLLPRITAEANRTTGHPDLSQRLAEAGILPMFGFPTKVRYLYTRRPGRSYPWPPSGTIDRALPIAVSQFAPGSETVRDGEVHTAIGIAAFEPGGHLPRQVPEPLGERRTVAYCLACGHLEEDAPPAPAADEPHRPCPACQSELDDFKTVQICQPEGFRSGFSRDFDGFFTWRARNTITRTAANLEQLSRLNRDRMTVHAGPGRRYSVNDNNGQLFTFQKAKAADGWGGYLCTNLLEEHSDLEHMLGNEPPEEPLALGASQHTDLFLLGASEPLDEAQGLRLNLERVQQPSGFREPIHGRRASWHSLAALLRRAACFHLDIQPNELSSGIHGSAGSTAPVYAFLADTLDNGAGYCTHLASSHDELAHFLKEAEQYLDGLEAERHRNECNASCYDCLRDYTNMAAHSMMDWRLARDLFKVLRGEALSINEDDHVRLLQGWAADFGAKFATVGSTPVAIYDGNDWSDASVAVVAKHPLEASDQFTTPRLAKAKAAIQETLPEVNSILFIDHFVLDRTPSAVRSNLDEWVDNL